MGGRKVSEWKELIKSHWQGQNELLWVQTIIQYPFNYCHRHTLNSVCSHIPIEEALLTVPLLWWVWVSVVEDVHNLKGESTVFTFYYIIYCSRPACLSFWWGFSIVYHFLPRDPLLLFRSLCVSAPSGGRKNVAGWTIKDNEKPLFSSLTETQQTMSFFTHSIGWSVADPKTVAFG